MDWKRRARELILAGGAFGLGACTSGAGGTVGGPPGIPCGNANPDPCICGRPDADPMLAMQCDAERACQADGGSWFAFYEYDQHNVLVASPHCEGPDGGPAVDSADDGSDAGADADLG
jgi:hypothetical protein